MGRTQGGRGLIQILTPTGPPNPGKVLINPNFLQNSGSYEFLNPMKHAQFPWTNTTANTHTSPTTLDSNGYPISLPDASGVWIGTFIPSQTSRPGNYQMTWTGNGTISITGATFVSGSFTGSGGSGLVVIAPTSTFLQIFITALSVTNMVLLHVNDISDFNAGKISGNKLRQRISQAQTPVWRLLNWIGGGSEGANNSNLTTWASRKPVGYVSYGGDEYRLSLFAGTTTNSGADYSITPVGGYVPGTGAPVDKQQIHVLINAAQSDHSSNGVTVTITNGTPSTISWTSHGLSANDPVSFGGFLGLNLNPELANYQTYYVKTVIDANTFTISLTAGGTAISTTGTSSGIVMARLPTLNVNGHGAIPIRDHTNRMLWVGAGTLLSTDYYMFTYDAALNCWFSTDAGGGIVNGVPPEVMIQFCAEIGCHPWFCTPPLSCDPMTDYHKQLALYIQANAPSWMVPRFECLNEPWNNLTLTGAYAAAKSYNNWPSTSTSGYGDQANFTGKIANTIGQDISAVFGAPDRSKYLLLVNVQGGVAANFPGGSPSGTLDDEYFNCPLYAAQGSTQANYNNTFPTKHYLTDISTNQYFQSQGTVANTIVQWNNASGAGAKQAVVDGYLATGNEYLATISNWASFNATISGTTMSVTSVTSGVLAVGAIVTGTGVTANTTITSVPGGGSTSTSTGSYGVTPSQTVSTSTAMQSSQFPPSTAQFTASISGNSMVVTSVNTGTLVLGATVDGAGVAPNTVITVVGGGGGAGTYTVTGSQTVGSETMTCGINNGLTATSANNNDGVLGLKDMITTMYTYAQTFTNSAGKVLGMHGYEGGWNLNDTSGGSTALFSTATKSATNLQSYYMQIYGYFISTTGGIPAEFQLSVQPGNPDVWSVFDSPDIYQSPDPPQWLAIETFNH